MTPRGLIFDLDGVLWESNALHDSAFRIACAEFGLSPLPYEMIAGKTTPEAWALIARSSQVHLSENQLTDLSFRKRELFLQVSNEAIVRDVDLEKLDKHFPETRWAIVTGASEGTLKAFLNRSSFSDRFSVLVHAGSGFASKPNPESYNAAISELDLSADACLIFEDSESGLAAALGSGARVAHVTNSSQVCSLHAIDSYPGLLACVTAPGDFGP